MQPPPPVTLDGPSTELDCQGLPCFAENCTDGRDNDLDGLVDCEDGDCWEACTVVSTVLDGELERHFRRKTHNSWRNFGMWETQTDQLLSVSGELEIATSSGTMVCHWWADRLVAHRMESWGKNPSSWRSSFSWETSGLTVDSACPVQGVDVLPPHLNRLHIGQAYVGSYHTYMRPGQRWLADPPLVASSYRVSTWPTDMSWARERTFSYTYAGSAVGYPGRWVR